MTAAVILIVSYNTSDLTSACLLSVGSRPVIVVDNASTDGSADAVAAEFPGVRLIRSERNLGFAAANNLAARHATGEYLLLLNPDTVVLEGAIDRLLEFAAAHPGAGIWGGRTLFHESQAGAARGGRLNPASCWGRPTLWSLICTATGLSSLFRGSALFNPESYGGWERDSIREVDIVSGCFLLIRRELWDRLGGFDPEFFMYGEDADLCLRARKLGARPMITPEATIIHYGGASERVRADKMVRLLDAKVRLIRRHWLPALVPLGVALLKAWPLTRAMAWGVISVVRGGGERGDRARESAACWLSVWARRSRWATAASPGRTEPALA
jgi:GT2 family glycosyltransferase